MNMSIKWKKRILVLSVIVVCMAILATGTAAYFVTEQTVYNVITTGGLYMDLVEETADGEPWPAEGITNVVPCMEVGKVVYVRNRGTVPFFTRVMVEKQLTPAEGVTAELNPEYITFEVNEDYWLEQDGLYYYYRELNPGEETEPLFTSVVLAPEMGNEYMDASAELYVLGQAVQSKNNGYDPLFALGWTEAKKTIIQDVDESQD